MGNSSFRPPASRLISGPEGNDSVTKPFSLAWKQKIVTRLTAKDAVSVRQLILKTGYARASLNHTPKEGKGPVPGAVNRCQKRSM